jgi:hypothetical protein
MGPTRDHLDLEPAPVDMAPQPRREVEGRASQFGNMTGDPGRPFVDIGPGRLDLETCGLDEIAEALRAPRIDVLIDVVGFVGPADVLAGHDEMQAAAALEQGAQGLQFAPWFQRMLQRVVRNDDVESAGTQLFQGIGAVGEDDGAVLDAHGAGSGVGLDAEACGACEVGEQIAAAAAEIEHAVGRFHGVAVLVDVGPAAELAVTLLPREIVSVVVRGGLGGAAGRFGHLGLIGETCP